jgi:2-polyprenyl-3-methyl-5-hydroxy-6-metoxy-1,4-benzoquinol methylase
MNESKKYYQHTRPEVAAFLPKTLGKVLEIGCGEGTFSVHLDGAEEYWGVEPVAEVAERAKKTVKTRVLAGIYEDVHDQLPDDFFDTVICNDVIEHMTSHDKFFEQIKKKMKQGGCLVGSIPNIRYLPVLFGLLVKRDWKYEESGVMDRTHFRYFTSKSLQRSFHEHGFRIESFEGINNLANVRESPAMAIRGMILKIFDLVTFKTQNDVMFQQFAFRVRNNSKQSL